MFALVDCNNFYVSCERVFRPELRNKPVIVLSNNDGCFISRSDEVKHLQIPMGAPYFKWKKEVEQHKAHVFSANFSLYGDISARVMKVLHNYSPQVEIYSIDEAFLQLKDIHVKATDYCLQMRQTIKQNTGIPTSIGIAPTKTLAKLANKIARKHPEQGGVYNFNEVKDIDKVLSVLPVELIWGIGYRSAAKLHLHGIKTVLQLKQANDKWLQSEFGVVGVRIAWELRGRSCLNIEEVRPLKKGVLSSRSFGKPISTLTELKEAIATYTSRAAEKLRADNCLAGQIGTFIVTNRFQAANYYSGSHSIPLPQPTADTSTLVTYSLKALEKIFKPGLYKKAGVFFSGIVPDTRQQMNLFQSEEDIKRKKFLMQAIDSINGSHGRRVIRFASEGTTRLWSTKSEQRSPPYTTSWKDLPIAKA